jgi:hypothetical protein
VFFPYCRASGAIAKRQVAPQRQRPNSSCPARKGPGRGAGRIRDGGRPCQQMNECSLMNEHVTLRALSGIWSVRVGRCPLAGTNL